MSERPESKVTLTVELHQALDVTNLVREAAEYLGESYELIERSELTFTTRDSRLAQLIVILAEQPAQEPTAAPLRVRVPDELLNRLGEELPALYPQPAAQVIEMDRHAPGPDPHGLTAAVLSEKSTICQACGQVFIRRRKGQTYCMREACQKVERTEYNKRYYRSKKAAAEQQAAL